MEYRNSKIKNLKYASTGLSALVFLFGLGCIMSLYFNLEIPYSDHPNSVGIVYNTALSFVMMGVAMLACIYKRCYVAALLLFLVVTNAVLVLIEHIFGINTGVDQLFFEHKNTYDAFPGRTTPSAAVCFILSSLAMLFQNHRCNNKMFIGIGGTLSMLVLTLGIVFVTGYINPLIDTIFWGAQTPMSKAAAIGFVLLGFTLLILSFYHSSLKSVDLARYIPVALSMSIFVATLTLMYEIYQALLEKQLSVSILYLTLLFGVLLAFMCGLFLYYLILSIETRRKLSMAQSILRSTLEGTLEGVVVVDLEGKIVAHNTRFLQMWGLPQNDESILNRRSLTKLVVGILRNREEYYLKRRQLAVNLSYEGNDFLELTNGSIYERHIMPQIIDNKIVGRVVSYRDTTAQKHLESELLHQATHDTLTELPNRVFMIDLIRRAITAPGAEIRKIALFLINVDNFSNINDLFGRSKGDIILKMIACRIQEQLNENCVLGRMDGATFLLMHTNLNTPDVAVTLISNIISALDKPFELHDNKIPIPITICTGITTYPKDAQTVDALLANADVAMLRSKVLGRSSFQFYEPSMNEYTLKHIEMESQLRRALVENRFVVYYQPIIDLTTLKTVGVEALVRLIDASGNLVPPNEFIPLAEKIGLITPIGEIVLIDACKQIKLWHDAGFVDLLVSVNISAQQFIFEAILHTIRDVIKISGIDPKQLELELTESTLLNTTDTVINILNQITSLGVSLSIDDFGTGFSSFNYIKHFAIHKIKIDQSFVRDAVNNPQDRIIVGAMVAMGKSLQFTMLAEGIETLEQQHLVAELGCTQGQGFLFAKPMTAADCTEFLKSS